MSLITNNLAKVVTYMTKPDAMAPIVGLEATVTGGRTVQAAKRGGENEARERLIEESTGAIVWLWGVKSLNAIGDKVLNKLFGANFDVGTDKVLRTPLQNFMKKQPPKNLSAKKVALIKTAKVLSSVLIADAFIGLVVPPLNQKLTRNLAKKKAETQGKEKSNDKLELTNKATKDPSFKGNAALSAINAFTNAIENTNTGKLLSTDAGLVSGRMYSARNKEERREIAIRDIGSIYFYMWAQNHVGNLLNFVQTGKFHRLDPNSAEILDKHLSNFLESKGGEMSVEEFSKKVLGKQTSEIKLAEGIKFETGEISKFDKFLDNFRKTKTEPLQVTTLAELKGKYNDPMLIQRFEEMSKLQPLRQGEAVLTKQQVIDAINISEINDPKLLDKVFGKLTNGAHKDEYKFVSNKVLYDKKAQMEDYVADICKKAKNGKVDKSLLKTIKNKNLLHSGVNFVAGFATAAIFLSTLIPKFQYWYTRKTTGKHEFPGTYELETSKTENK